MRLARVLAAVTVAAILAPAASAAPPAPGELRLIPGQCAAGTGCPGAGPMSPDGRDSYRPAFGTVDRRGLIVFHRRPGATLPTPVAGPLGCIAPVKGRVCQALDPHQGDPTPPVGSVAISPDGRFVYVTDKSNAAIYAFARDAETGKLLPLWDRGSCLGNAFSRRCDIAAEFVGPSIVSVSDNEVASTFLGDRATSIVQRDPITGRLSQKPHSCLDTPKPAGICTPIPFLGPVWAVGRQLYARENGGFRLYTQAAGGAWVPAPGADGCAGPPGCQPLGFDPVQIVVPSDGASLYVSGVSRIAVFRRNPATGRLTTAGLCYGAGPCSPGVVDAAEFSVPSLAFRGDGRAGLIATKRLRTFTRNPATGALTANPFTDPCATLTASGLSCPIVAFGALSTDGLLGLWGSLMVAMERPPSCDGRARHAVPGRAITIAFGCTDVNGDAFTTAVSTPPAHGTFSANAGGTGGTYTPAPGFSGADSLRLHLAGPVTADAVIPIVVAAASSTAVTDIQVPDPFFTRQKSPSVPRVAVFYRDPVVLTGRVRHGGEPVANATVRATGYGGAATAVTDDQGGGDVIVPALRSHRITFGVVGFPAGTPGRVDLEVSPDILLDRFYSLRKGKIRYGARLKAQSSARLGRVDLQKRVHGTWRTVQKLKIDRRLHVLGSIPKAQYRGPWRFRYVARKAPYFPAVYPFTLGKPRVARLAGGAITGRAIAGRRGH